MRKIIPAPIIAILSEELPNLETHASIDNIFMYADVSFENEDVSKPVKVANRLRQINKEHEDPLKVLGKLIEKYMETPEKDVVPLIFGVKVDTNQNDLKTNLTKTLGRYNLSYRTGGFISDGSSAPSKNLAELIKGRHIPSIEAEFDRALDNINSEPREAVSAACNILESIFKVYIEDEGLVLPQKQDLQNLWKIVKKDLGFDPASLEDDDLKKVLSGMLSVVDGIGAFRTHASSAHGRGRRIYNLKPRHARLAINSAHTIAMFILETWDENKLKIRK
jgi:hypothetical protein